MPTMEKVDLNRYTEEEIRRSVQEMLMLREDCERMQSIPWVDSLFFLTEQMCATGDFNHTFTSCLVLLELGYNIGRGNVPMRSSTEESGGYDA